MAGIAAPPRTENAACLTPRLPKLSDCAIKAGLVSDRRQVYLLDPGRRLGELRGAPGDVEHELFLGEAGRPHRAGVVAAVARVEHERAERSHLLLLRLGLGRTGEIEEEGMRVRERARARGARHA